MIMKLLNLLMIFLVVLTLTAGNGITTFLQSGIGVQWKAIAWGNPALIEGNSGGQVDATDVTTRRLAKRAMDLGVIVLLSPVWIPALAVLCLVIFIERASYWDFGPVFITEPRFSMGRKFDMYKINLFREHARQRYIRESQEFKKDPTFNYLHRDPSSLSYMGRFMKKFYLDELGQIVNILKGQMSVVGPRPLPMDYEVNSYPPRLILKTGVFCFPANRSKSRGDTTLNYSTDEQYLEQYRRSSVWDLIKLDWLIIMDGISATLKGYG
tara:strand:+ start:372 stop:1175 length:804 start_codon:yes stop_codon:yes gene_type:complete